MPHLCLLMALFAGGAAQAEPRRLTLTGEDPAARYRVQAIDQLTSAVRSSAELARLVGAAGGGPWAPLVFLGSNLPPEETWVQALDEYLRLRNEAGDILIPLGPEAHPDFPSPSLAASQLVQLRLCHLPPSLRPVLKKRQEASAQRMLDHAVESRSLAQFRRLAEEHFTTRAGAVAMNLLGELAFEQGRLNEAQACWSKLVPLPGPAPRWNSDHFRHPDSVADPAFIQARQILALIMSGRVWESQVQLKEFRRHYPRARGKIAGQDGLLHVILSNVRDSQERFLHKDSRAMSMAPGRAIPLALSPRLWAQGPSWNIFLPEGLAHAPATLILEDNVLLAPPSGFMVLHVQSGKTAAQWRWPEADKVGRTGALFEQVFLAAKPGKVVLALAMGESKSGDGRTPGLVACLGWSAHQDQKMDSVAETWRAEVRWSDGQLAQLAGAPLALNDYLLVPLSLSSGFRTQLAVAALDWRRGKVVWFQELAQIDEPGSSKPLRGHAVNLTSAGTAVVACIHAGAVVALDPATGQRQWGQRFPTHQEVTDRPDAAPDCFALSRCLYFSPADSQRIFCLDLFTGVVLWQRERFDQAQLFALSQNRLLLKTSRGLRGLDALTGQDVPGWQQPALGRLATKGEGVAMGDWVIWPTTDPIFPVRALSLQTGSLELETPSGHRTFEPTLLRRLPAGNFIFGHGCLVVVNSAAVAGFVGE